MSLLADAYREIAKDPASREPLSQIAHLYRLKLAAIDANLTNLPIAIEALGCLVLFFQQEKKDLSDEIEAIEESLRERAQ